MWHTQNDWHRKTNFYRHFRVVDELGCSFDSGDYQCFFLKPQDTTIPRKNVLPL
jgi:hypothetical protein